MLVPDLNVLLYAANRDSPEHQEALAWWTAALDGDEAVGLSWLVVLGFVRIATSARVFPRPIAVEQALSMVDDWLDSPVAEIIEPTARHWEILRGLMVDSGAAGNLTSDAHLAALAIEHSATLCSTDRDFGRFEKLRLRNPLARRR